MGSSNDDDKGIVETATDGLVESVTGCLSWLMPDTTKEVTVEVDGKTYSGTVTEKK